MYNQHYLFAGTIFQDNKLDLYKLILGLYIFFTSTKGMSAIELANELDVNYKTALFLSRKCRILMSNSNTHKLLAAIFYEADKTYIGAKSKEKRGTEQQPFLVVLSTKQENSIPKYIKMHVLPRGNAERMKKIRTKSAKLSLKRTHDTDGKHHFLV
ncbi:MAG: hypothetical protein ACK5L6_06020 [Anaerorhabdus sp.]|uniref:hypothetical protein n=1 Tax=Anaerorhabdus sp. TaxID=1872524 RepID=UPI003A8868B5